MMLIFHWILNKTKYIMTMTKCIMRMTKCLVNHLRHCHHHGMKVWLVNAFLLLEVFLRIFNLLCLVI